MREFSLLLALLVLVGCRTPYRAYDCEPGGNPWPFPGWNCEGGYSELQLAPDTYQVSFSGRNISTEKSQDYALLRAAELTLEKGHRKFFVLQAWGQMDVQVNSSPHIAQTAPGGSGVTMTTGVGGGSSNVRLPQAAYVIRFLDDSQDQAPNAYDARMIQASVRGKYRLPQDAR